MNKHLKFSLGAYLLLSYLGNNENNAIMKVSKTLVFIGMFFAILYSCSASRPSAASKKKEIKVWKPIVEIKPTTNVIDTLANKELKKVPTLKEVLNDQLKDKKQDHVLMSPADVLMLKQLIDSIFMESKKEYAYNASLAFNDVLNQRKILGERELLLIEREKRVELEKKNKQLEQVTVVGDKYTNTLLVVGVLINILMTAIFHFYRKKQIKKFGIIHA